MLMKDYIYFSLWNFLYINLESPFKTMKKLKGVFKPLKVYFKCGKSWYPILWCSRPYPIHIMSGDVMWKDKYDTPRYENPPYVWIHLFGFNLVWYWALSRQESMDNYWEQALWYLYYYRNISYGILDVPDINKAEESWPWQDYDTKETTWENKYLVKNETKR